jgi:hypothetical protein
MKGKMWREYRNIRNELETRIASGDNCKPIKPRKSKKTNQIMKCLSDQMLKHRYQHAEKEEVQP